MGMPGLRGASAPLKIRYNKRDNSGRKQLPRTAIIKGGDREARSFVSPASREIFGLFARDFLASSHSDERLCDSWNARPSCVLTHLPLLLFRFVLPNSLVS